MYRLVIRLINKDGCIIDSYVAEHGETPTEALKSAISIRLWILSDGDSISVQNEYVDDYDK